MINTKDKINDLLNNPEDKKIKTASSNKKKIIYAVLSLGIITGGLLGSRWWAYASTHIETDNATIAGHIHPISPRISGTVTAVLVNNNQQVHQGDVLVKLDKNDYQVKVALTEAELENAKKQAQAAQQNITLADKTAEASSNAASGNVNGAIAMLDSAIAAVEEAKAGIPTAEAGVKEAQAGVAAAQAQVAVGQANLEKAEKDYQRYINLHEEGVISSSQLDANKAAYQVAVAQKTTATEQVQQAQSRVAESQEIVKQAQAKLIQVEKGVVNAQSQIASSQGELQQAQAKNQQTEVNRAQYAAAQATIAQAQANLDEAKLNLKYTEITAPTDGKVGRKAVEIGQRVQAESLLMAIVGNEYWIVANFKETQLENMKPGQEVEIKIDAFPDHKFIGKVDSLSPASGAQFSLLPPDNATGNFTKIVQRLPVKIIFDPESIKGYESRLSPGMSASVSVKIKE